MNKSIIPQIQYVSAPCGSGKTYSTCRYIKRYRYKRNHLYVAPTIRLIEETEKTLRETFGIISKVITTQTAEKRVNQTIVEHLTSCGDRGEVLLITLAAFLDLPRIHRRKKWNIYIDEIPQIDQFYALDLHQNPEHLTKHIRLLEPLNDSIHPVRPRKMDRIKELLKNPDDITRQFKPFYQDLIGTKRDMYVDHHSWIKLENNQVSRDRDCNRVYLLSMLKPKVFDGCIMLGANFEESLFYDWACSGFHCVDMVKHDEIRSGLRYERHSPEIGKRLRISYLLANRGHSKYQMQQEIVGTDLKWVDAYDLAVAQHFGAEDFIYAVNNDYDGKLSELNTATKMKTISHGLNEYDKEVNCYFGPALNRPTQHLKLMNHLGFANERIKTSTLHEATYQGIMRTALRDPDSKAIVNVVVPEYETAVCLVNIFNAETETKRITDDAFKKVRPLTPAQRNQRNRFFKRQNDLFGAKSDNQGLGGEYDHLHQIDYDSPIKESSKELSNQIGADFCDSPDPILLNPHRSGACDADGRAACPFFITFHGHITDKNTEVFLVAPCDHRGMVKWMRETSRVVVSRKDELFLFNPAIYGNFDPNGHRRKANFLESAMMVLDFDNGDLSIEEFERIFWFDAGRGRRSFLICNSFSRSAIEPNRFRVMMLYKSPVQSIEVHRAIYDSIVTRLKDHGYTEKSSGLDPACRTGVQSFYPPGINRGQQEFKHFKAWGTSAREIKRYAIDPESIEKTIIRPVDKPQVCGVSPGSNSITFDDGGDKEDSIQQILDSVRALKQGRHDPFFIAGVLLRRKLGLPEHEVQFLLEQLEVDIGKQSKHWAKYAMQSMRN